MKRVYLRNDRGQFMRLRDWCSTNAYIKFIDVDSSLNTAEKTYKEMKLTLKNHLEKTQIAYNLPCGKLKENIHKMYLHVEDDGTRTVPCKTFSEYKSRIKDRVRTQRELAIKSKKIMITIPSKKIQ